MPRSIGLHIAAIVFLASLAQFAAGAAWAQKAPIVGLIQMGRQAPLPPTSQHPPLGEHTDNNAYYFIPNNTLDNLTTLAGSGIYFEGTVINVAWREIQPCSPSDFNTATIDNALTDIANYNTQNPLHPLHAILRVWAAVNAPAWVKSTNTGLAGVLPNPNNVTTGAGSVIVYPGTYDGNPYDPQPPGTSCTISPTTAPDKNGSRTIPQFWTQNYIYWWRNLQYLLAQQYDSNPLIVEIADTSCGSTGDQAYSLGYQFDASATPPWSSTGNLLNAGFTHGAYEACLSNSPADYQSNSFSYTAWTNTRTNFDVNSVEQVLSNNNGFTFPQHVAAPTITNILSPTTGWLSPTGWFPGGWQALQAPGQQLPSLILANHGLSYQLDKDRAGIYSIWQQTPAVNQLGQTYYPTWNAPMEFQEFNPYPYVNGDVTDPANNADQLAWNWQRTIDEAVCHGSNTVELWNVGFMSTQGTLNDWASRLTSGQLSSGGFCSAQNVLVTSSMTLPVPSLLPSPPSQYTNASNVYVPSVTNLQVQNSGVTITLPSPGDIIAPARYSSAELTTRLNYATLPFVVVTDYSGNASSNGITITTLDHSPIIGDGSNYNYPTNSSSQRITTNYGVVVLQVIASGSTYRWKIVRE